MKLLLRQFGDECYVWKNAEMNDEKTFIKHNFIMPFIQPDCM